MRLTDFTELMRNEFGTMASDSMLRDHVLSDLGNRTGAVAIEEGVDPREVWLALCRDFDVPRDRWYLHPS
ncbi:DUF3046 domain-containing protein [Williamsia sterculiae]|uniref:DUF3046 domain-containing protein n=1 Tax=Williamsia sterculiae TaxID=1344003 RepID=A0A1N7EDV2_9NOCA|nr:DUF3046 domain-containing protein [Williamsia sterculiae]SIR86214.1 Protein of unknown function [Williamsia sterculiae]